MKNIVKIAFIISLFGSCKSDSQEKNNYILKDAIYFETPDKKSSKYPNPFDNDNEIYIPNQEFVFEYLYIDSSGNQYLFDKEGYELTPLDSVNTATITKIALSIEYYQTEMYPDYNQTLAEYLYYLPRGDFIYPRSYSGIVENGKNVWMHPFRTPCYFRLLQLAPFPFIQKPLEIGKKWNWSLISNDQWDCAEWGEWKGNINSKYNYEILDFLPVKTTFGELDCYLVKATGDGDLGESELKSYFNEKFGFVKLEYKNVNKSKLIIDLVEIKQ